MYRTNRKRPCPKAGLRAKNWYTRRRTLRRVVSRAAAWRCASAGRSYVLRLAGGAQVKNWCTCHGCARRSCIVRKRVDRLGRGVGGRATVPPSRLVRSRLSRRGAARGMWSAGGGRTSLGHATAYFMRGAGGADQMGCCVRTRRTWSFGEAMCLRRGRSGCFRRARERRRGRARARRVALPLLPAPVPPSFAEQRWCAGPFDPDRRRQPHRPGALGRPPRGRPGAPPQLRGPGPVGAARVPARGGLPPVCHSRVLRARARFAACSTLRPGRASPSRSRR